MKRLFNINLDVTDYLLSNNIEPVADLVSGLSDMAKTASVHSAEERDLLVEEESALILYHPRIGELKKFACDTKGVTEININLLANHLNELPEEVIKTAANNLGYVAKHLGVDVPESLQVYQTGEWSDPYVDVTHLNKVAFYQKLQENAPEDTIEKEAEAEVEIYHRDRFSEDLLANIDARLKMTHNEKVAGLYTDIRENHSKYTPEEVCKVLEAADKMGNMGRAIERGMFKGAEAATFELIKTSWFKDNIDKLRGMDCSYMSKEAYMSLFDPEDGEDVFNSLPKPTKDRLIEDIKSRSEE